jgi:hypothetical protein
VACFLPTCNRPWETRCGGHAILNAGEEVCNNSMNHVFAPVIPRRVLKCPGILERALKGGRRVEMKHNTKNHWPYLSGKNERGYQSRRPEPSGSKGITLISNEG